MAPYFSLSLAGADCCSPRTLSETCERFRLYRSFSRYCCWQELRCACSDVPRKPRRAEFRRNSGARRSQIRNRQCCSMGSRFPHLCLFPQAGLRRPSLPRSASGRQPAFFPHASVLPAPIEFRDGQRTGRLGYAVSASLQGRQDDCICGAGSRAYALAECSVGACVCIPNFTPCPTLIRVSKMREIWLQAKTATPHQHTYM